MKSAAELITAQHKTATQARIAVLDVLLSEPLPLSHPEIQKRISSLIDRVTIYRVLDWLVENDFAHAVISPDKTRRFKANTEPHHHQHNNHQHAHFECNNCGQVICLENISPTISQALPKAFSIDAIHLNITGICASCQLVKS